MNTQHHTTDVQRALAAAGVLTGADPAADLAELATLAELLGRFAEQSRKDLATWATVSPHLAQARDQAAALARSLHHASGTLAYNSSVRVVA
ncbi:hypothetical protein [Saccharopolyspora thermophila]|nr:hypothetical protein [Saccharopolyspora subtropica]